MDAYMGTITVYGFNYAPQDWALCQARLIRSRNTKHCTRCWARSTAARPRKTQAAQSDRSHAHRHRSRQPTYNLPAYNPGQFGGTQNVALSVANLPAHSHTATSMAVTFHAAGTPTPATPASAPSASNPYLGASGAGTGLATIWSTALNNPVSVQGLSATGNTDLTGGNTPVSVLNPFLALNFCIAINGLYPVRP